MGTHLIKSIALCMTGVCVVLLQASAVAPSRQDVPLASVGGIIEDASGAPLADVTVVLLNAFSPVQTAVTDDKGIFFFAAVVPGEYRFDVRKPGYIRSGERSHGATGIVDIGSARQNRFTFRLNKTHSVFGRISDVNGMPLPGASVQLLYLEYDSRGIGFLEALPTLPPVVTDAEGDYEIVGVPPGDWYLRAAWGSRDSVASTLVAYYPAQENANFAVPISVSSSDLYSVDVRINNLPQHKISGRIANPFSENRTYAPAPTFYLVRKDVPTILTERTRPVTDHDPAGDRFEIQNVPSGNYDLYASVPIAPGPYAIRYTDRVQVNVQDEDITDVSLSLKSGVDIKGWFVLDPDGANRYREFSGFSAILRSRDGRPPELYPRGFTDPPVPTTSAGHFEFRGAADGQYYLLAVVPRDLYVSAARLGFRDVRIGEVFDITADTEGPLIISVSGDGATLTGLLTDAANRPVSSATVVLVPPLEFRNDLESYRFAMTGIGGRFTIAGIRPGRYSAFAVRRVGEPFWLNPLFMNQIQPFAVFIDFRARQQVTLDLKVIAER